MASPETPILPPAPDPPKPPPPITAEIAGPTAKSILGEAALRLKQAFDLIDRGTARQTAETWDEEFWAVCGYNKAAVMAAMDQLEAFSQVYHEEYEDDANILMGAS